MMSLIDRPPGVSGFQCGKWHITYFRFGQSLSEFVHQFVHFPPGIPMAQLASMPSDSRLAPLCRLASISDSANAHLAHWASMASTNQGAGLLIGFDGIRF